MLATLQAATSNSGFNIHLSIKCSSRGLPQMDLAPGYCFSLWGKSVKFVHAYQKRIACVSDHSESKPEVPHEHKTHSHWFSSASRLMSGFVLFAEGHRLPDKTYCAVRGKRSCAFVCVEACLWVDMCMNAQPCEHMCENMLVYVGERVGVAGRAREETRG